jgi:hypothetical protein
LVREPRDATPFEIIEDVREVARRAAKVARLLPQHLECASRMKVKLVEQEVIGMGTQHVRRMESLVWEVFQVERDNRLGTSSDGRGKHVAIVWIRQVESGAHWFPAPDEGVFEC